MNKMCRLFLMASSILGTISCATRHRNQIHVTSIRLDSSTILVNVCNRTDGNEVVPRFKRRDISHVRASAAGDTIELTWFSSRSNSPGWSPPAEPYVVVGSDSCVPVLLVDGVNTKVKYLKCVNLPYLGTIVLPATGAAVVDALPPKESFVGGFNKP